MGHLLIESHQTFRKGSITILILIHHSHWISILINSLIRRKAFSPGIQTARCSFIETFLSKVVLINLVSVEFVRLGKCRILLLLDRKATARNHLVKTCFWRRVCVLIFLWELINRTKRLLENPESSVLIVSLGYAAKLLGLFLRDDVLLEGVYGLLLKILDVQLALFLDFIQSKNRLNTTTFDGTRFKFSTPPFQGVPTYKISCGL